MFTLKYFHGASTKIYLHEHLTHEYFHTQKFLYSSYYKTLAVENFGRFSMVHNQSTKVLSANNLYPS